MLSGALILFTILEEGDQRRQTSKINKGAAVYIVYYLNGPYTQKLESPYKDPSSTFGSERVKLLKMSSHHCNSKKMDHFFYLRLYSGIESVSRPLFEQVTRMKMDGNFKKNMAHLNFNYPAKSTPEKATESLLRLLLPNEICLILSS